MGYPIGEGKTEFGTRKNVECEDSAKSSSQKGLLVFAAGTAFHFGRMVPSGALKTKDCRCRSDCGWLKRERARGALGEAFGRNYDAQWIENEACARTVCLGADSARELARAMLQWRA